MDGWTRKIRVVGALIAAVALALPAAVYGEPTESWTESANWTQWGGPRHDFYAPSEGIASEWAEGGPPPLWTRELGDGYSTILAEDGRLYTMYRPDDQEAVICLDADTGETIWEHRYDHDPAEGHVSQFGDGPRSTPLIAGDRLFTIGVAGKMHALSKSDGKVQWTHDLWGEEFGGSYLNHGYSSSPIAYKDKVIALVGGEGKSIVAFKQSDGSVAWQSGDFKNSYSTPRILEVDGQTQLVTFMASEAVGLDPDTGGVKWTYAIGNQFEQNINPPSLVDGQYLFLSSTSVGARGLKLTNKGDKTEVEELWSTRKVQFYHVTSVRDGDYVYGCSGARSPAFMAAVNVKTGEIPWRKRGFGKANAVWADGKMIVLDEDGKLYLTTPTPEDLTVHSEAQILDRVAWSTPTIVGKTLYVRDKSNIMALDLSPGAKGKPAMAEKMEPEATEEMTEPKAEEMADAEDPMAPSPDDSEGVVIFKKADAAVKKVTTVRYKGRATPTGIATNFVSAGEGHGILHGWAGRNPEKFYAWVKTTRPGTDEAVELSGGSDGETFFLINHTAKKAYEDFDPNVMGSGGQTLGMLGMPEFVHPAPFNDEVAAEKIEVLGKEEIHGESCYKIDVTYSGGQGRSTWLISANDYLPRGRIRYFSIPNQGEGTLETFVYDLEVDPEVDDDVFSLELPEGFEKVDDFAP